MVKNLCSLVAGLIGFAMPIAGGICLSSEYDPKNLGIYLGVSAFVGIFTGITGIHYINRSIQQQ